MKASEKNVNDTKSEIFFINTEAKMKNQIYQIIGYKKGVFLCKYLGIELEKSIKSSKVWNNTFEKMETKIESWKDKWLSKVGKSIKIRSVLTAILTYPLLCLPLPKNLFHRFKVKFKNFLCNDCEES